MNRNRYHPKVSVCVITFNHGYYLRECLQSIVDQVTNFSFEVIVGDDCSTDGISEQILLEFSENYPNLIIPITREKNMGDGGTQNYLDVMKKAKGDYIVNIDGDDRMLPGKLQKQADYLDLNSDCTIVVHDLRVFNGANGKMISKSISTKKIPKITDINYLVLNRCYFGHSSKMFRRSALMSLNRDKPTFDFFFHIEHASKGYIGYIHEVLGEYRKLPGSASDHQFKNYDAIISGYDDSFERAIELGVDHLVVARARLLMRYSCAYSALDSSNYCFFKKYIHLNFSDLRLATLKHIFLYSISFFPKFAFFIIKTKQLLF